MPKRPLCVAFLWHMHQPDYSDTQTSETRLPWTRLHAVKDYYDMGALAAQVPGMHLTINVAPSLIDQLESYSWGTARELYAALTLRNAADLDEGEKRFLLRGFFQLNWKNMVFPYPRYKELLDRRGGIDERGEYPEGLRNYDIHDYRDLQVWFNLAWCGDELRRDPEIDALFRKGRGFAEEEKENLLKLQYSLIGRILPWYRKLMEEHGLELSVTPYYHPILPLLCDQRSALEADPELVLPEEPFSFPSDAVEHIQRARRRYEVVFGRPPRGMWPSEGAISDSALALAREAGLAWLASDEDVLANSLRKCGHWNGSLRPEQKYSAHRWGQGGSGPCLFFRDHELSDLIGFTYSGWSALDATADFLSRLRAIRDSLPDDGRHYVVPVILDGENAWEHYPDNGSGFLGSLYRGIVESGEFRPVGFSEFLELEPGRETLESVVAGSWIYASLATWTGHPEKNRAWDELSVTRRFLQSRLAGQSENRMFEAAFREMLIAEGSDWFWWYGDDHHSQNAAEFDALFRNHLKNVYRLMGEKPPVMLDAPIKKTHESALFSAPERTITPSLDGKGDECPEWLAAGFAGPAGGGSMQRAGTHFEKIFFGYDAARFYLRIDLKDLQSAIPAGRSVQVRFVAPVECLLDIVRDGQNQWHCIVVQSFSPSFRPDLGVDRVIELGVPLEALGIGKTGDVSFFVSLLDTGHELERFPSSDIIAVPVIPAGH